MVSSVKSVNGICEAISRSTNLVGTILDPEKKRYPSATATASSCNTGADPNVSFVQGPYNIDGWFPGCRRKVSAESSFRKGR